MPDPRFARLKTDPRFRRPKKQAAKVVIDERFQEIFDNPKSKRTNANGVDKYGRSKAASHDGDNLKRFYRLKNEDKEPSPLPDLARGEVLLESSDEDDDNGGEHDGSDSDPARVVAIGGARVDLESEVDLDESQFADLDAQAEAFAKLNPEVELPGGERTHRIAVVNLDWDHVRANHLYKIFSSLLSPTAPSGPTLASSNLSKQISQSSSCPVVRGKVLSVRVYPSQYGKERLAKEETEGPPAEIFRKAASEKEEDINERTVYDVGNEDDYNNDALRKYQLERLRYYYAIVTCDTIEAADHIYKQLDGTELERSANVFDLSFVPDGMVFDDVFRDEATELDPSIDYKHVDFVTDALRHSKVKLTWDDDDPQRIQITKRALSQKEIDEADFKAFLASASSASDDDESEPVGLRSTKVIKCNTRNSYRALLLGGDHDDMPEGWDFESGKEDVDMQITFTPGLSGAKDDGEETSLDKYQRKLKEKRKKRKEEIKGKLAQKGKEAQSDDFFEAESDSDLRRSRSSTSKTKEKHRLDKHAGHDASSSHINSTAEEPSLLVGPHSPSGEPSHFNMKSILKVEKGKKRRTKGKSPRQADGDENELQEGFKIDIKDDRFKVLLDDHAFAIDPSNPHFQKTKSMAVLLDERSKRQRAKLVDDGHDASVANSVTPGRNTELKALVESVKRKHKALESSSTLKRRRT